MKLLINIFLSLFCCMSVLSPISAEEKTTFVSTNPIDPYTFPMLLSDFTTIDFDNSNMCNDWDTLTSEQQNTITSNIGLNNYNFAFITSDNKVYLGTSVWISSFDTTTNSYTIHSQSNISNPGFFLISSDGSLSKQSELGTFTIKSIFYALYDVGSYWFDDIDIRTSNCEVVVNPINPPSLELPTPNAPNVTINQIQNEYLNTNSSDSVKGGVLNYFVIDHFNIYACYQTSESDQFFDNRNDIYYVYQESRDGVGHYIFAVYDYSELIVFAPNMSVSSGSFTLSHSEYNNIKYSYASSSGLIQRDINKFEFKYVDADFLDFYDISQLPFDNSTDNQNKIEWLGTRTKMLNGGATSMSTQISVNGTNIDTTFTFIITDTENAFQNAQSLSNQVTINNNLNNNFTNLDNVLQHGNTTSQNAQSALDSSNNTFDFTINEFNQLDQQANQDLINNLNNIDVEQFELTGIAKLTNASQFVRAQFDNLTNNNPIGISIGFGLVVGLALLLLARRV